MRSLFFRRWLAIALLLSLVLLVVSCTPSHPQSTFDAAGPVSKNQLNLFFVIFWAAVAVFIVVVGLLLYSVIRFRARPGQGIPSQVHGNRRLEIAWTIVPALLLMAIAVMTVRTIFDLENPPSDELVGVSGEVQLLSDELRRASEDPLADSDELQRLSDELRRLSGELLRASEDPLRVEVIAHQWWWEVIYSDFNITTANEIRVPVYRDVSITLNSIDVIHSFWVPKLRGKKDVIPNNTNTTWFRADEVGIFQGQCTEFCGIAHALMRFTVIAETEEDFLKWIEGQQALAATPTGKAVEGAQLFASKGCVVCHTTTGPDTSGIAEARHQAFLAGQPVTHAPNLTHFASRLTFAGGISENTEGNLTRWLRDPEDFKPGNRMARLALSFNDPQFALSEEDISALVAYLRSLE